MVEARIGELESVDADGGVGMGEVGSDIVGGECAELVQGMKDRDGGELVGGAGFEQGVEAG
ncbi:MAG: hypothetical protein RI897_623 [Verrucomicrobiota bacterium]